MKKKNGIQFQFILETVLDKFQPVYDILIDIAEGEDVTINLLLYVMCAVSCIVICNSMMIV